ncbi:MAG: porin family protein, partial [Gammaproteobacteria bacterium]|nr:porin family protein [Gammaproteobacteria bacterium]
YTGITVITPQGPFTPPLSEVVVPVEGNVKQMGVAMNLWYDFNAGSKWRPYAGGGLMWVRVDQSDLSYDEQAFAQAVANSLGADPFPPGYVARVADTENVLGYHIGAGIGYEWSEKITVHAGYRRQTTRELSFKGSNANSEVESTTDLRVNFFEVGLRYRF